MKDAILFGGVEVFDFIEIRSHVLRIPDVMMRMEEAQVIWDEECDSTFSFQQFFCSENLVFFNNINLKTLTSAVVQLGLFDRYCRRHEPARFMIGDVANDAPVRVAAGLQTLKDLVTSSRACSLIRPLSPVRIAETEPLIGQRLPSYGIFEVCEDQTYALRSQEKPSRVELIRELVEKRGVKNLIHVGPGASKLLNELKESGELDLQVGDTVDMDPFLSWFWRDVRDTSQTDRVAQ